MMRRVFMIFEDNFIKNIILRVSNDLLRTNKILKLVYKRLDAFFAIYEYLVK